MRAWSTLPPLALLLVLVPLVVAPAVAAQAGAQAEAEEPHSENGELLGDLTREEIEAAVPSWIEEQVGVEVDPESAARLASVGEGAEVVVYLGTWCSDSRREVSRLWRNMDAVGGLVPWSIRYVGIAEDHDRRPADLVTAVDLRYLPTIVVLEGGVERGRIVESSPSSVERDLAALLGGETEGVLTGRDDL